MTIHIKRVLSLPPDTVMVDLYGGGRFTVEELTRIVAGMRTVESPKAINEFLSRFNRLDPLKDSPET